MLELILSTLTALAVLAAGLIFAYLAFRLVYEQLRGWRLARKSQEWAVTTGQIERSEIIYEGVRHPRELPAVGYRYRVGGTDYQGERIDFSFAQIYDRQEAEAVLARYPLHGHVTVYYDPAHPAESVLEPRQPGRVSGILLGFVVLLPGCLCLAVGLVVLSGKVGR